MGHVVTGRENRDLFEVLQGGSLERIKGLNGFDLIPEEIDPNGLILFIGRE